MSGKEKNPVTEGLRKYDLNRKSEKLNAADYTSLQK